VAAIRRAAEVVAGGAQTWSPRGRYSTLGACTVEGMPAGDIYTEQQPSRAARVDGGMVLSELIASTKDGGIVYLTDDGDVVAAVAPIEVVEAGLQALGRDKDGHAQG
jgi:hypothetical protein